MSICEKSSSQEDDTFTGPRVPYCQILFDFVTRVCSFFMHLIWIYIAKANTYLVKLKLVPVIHAVL